jgi:hypothetical protein
MHQNTIDKAKHIANIVLQYYEPGRQDRCLLWCYRSFIAKQFHVSERTFWRYMKIAKVI